MYSQKKKAILNHFPFCFMVAFKWLFSMSCMTQTVECYFSIEFSLEETHVEGPIWAYAVE